MRIYTRSGDLAFKTFTFPDGQPHFKLETYEKDFESVTIETAIKSPSDLFMVLLVCDVLRQHGFQSISLSIRYLMGARMDRAISWAEPFTLATVSRLVNGAGFASVRILDVHSDQALKLIRNSVNILPTQIVSQVYETLNRPNIVCPDKGAVGRTSVIAGRIRGCPLVIHCDKVRDMSTGALSGFHITETEWVRQNPNCLIVDDICDGGGTFVGLSKELRKAGATKVSLYVTHGIFSKGLPLEGIDHVYTTDSYFGLREAEWMNGNQAIPSLTVIPVSMEKL